MVHKRIIVLLSILLIFISAYSFPYSYKEKLVWDSIQKVTVDNHFSFERLFFNGAIYKRFEIIPHFNTSYPIHADQATLESSLINVQTEIVRPAEAKLLAENAFSDTIFRISSQLVISRKEPFANVEVIPVRWNAKKQLYEKLLSFEIVIEVTDIQNSLKSSKSPATNSVLASGDWYKVRISESGIYKITYAELQAMGFDITVNPKNIAIFGNGGGILPEVNTDFRYDDLVENPIVVVGENDGTLNPDDYILFYGEGPVVWKYNYVSGNFTHQNNYYDNYSYYFITASAKAGKRISTVAQPTEAADLQLNSFTDYAYHELDERNLAGTGRIWYGELFDFNATYEFDFNFPNLKTSEEGFLQADFASISTSANLFEIYVNDEKETTLVMPTISTTNSYQIARGKSTSFSFAPSGDQLNVKIIYKKSSSSSSGYLNYIDLNVERELKMAGNQLMFRKVIGKETASVIGYNLSNANNAISIWDITEVVNPRKVDANLVSGKLQFKATNDSLRQYIAFNGQEYFTTEFIEKVENQNLHSVKNVDYLIISHPDFLSQAQKLADFHANNSNLNVFVTTPEKIYNEFSSGSQDITAIRDFAKMLYDYSDSGKEIKYMLLFGDASYDYKDILPDNTNYVPCWETATPINDVLNIVHSVASDDYFGYLDDGEGNPESTKDKVDIGIGRFVVATVEESENAINKTIHYAENSSEVMGPWRNMLTFVTDDGDNNRHLTDGETLSGFIQANYPVYNINKIYLDAYQQISTPSGQEAPDVNQAINSRISKGTLVMNYNGHGGEIGWGHERFLKTSDINSWTNYDKLPIFITATCEFSRYDDPTRVSAGEMVFLNSKGGGIALFTTARATFASSNLALNMAIYENNLFEKENGNYPCFGDVIRKSKVLGGDNDKKFILIGDPALKLAYTDYVAETLKINGKLVLDNVADTLKALSQITIEGEVTDDAGNLMSNYDGIIFPTIYDKFSEIETLGDESSPTKFNLRQSILFNGKASVNRGEFKVEFVVPKDIAYNFGNGRISYYLNNETEDGSGYYENIIIGGYDKSASEDNEGPLIDLFINDTTFINGGTTDQNPKLFAKVFDESGINTTGNGIGHDILAWFDNDDNQTYKMNEYYEANVDTYNSGQITYPFYNLEDGDHVLTLKVWDIYNNSSTASINFTVVSDYYMVIDDLMNYPNPFQDATNFMFKHNQSGQELDVNIQIFTASGQLIKTIETQMQPEGYKSDPVYWDATTDNGGKIGRGFYVYRVTVTNEAGLTSSANAKLVFIR